MMFGHMLMWTRVPVAVGIMVERATARLMAAAKEWDRDWASQSGGAVAKTVSGGTHGPRVRERGGF